MKPPPFEYVAPTSLEEALDLLRTYGPEAKVLAGGQSLLPLLNFRLARPRYLVDVNRIASLAYVRPWSEGGLAIGAMTRQRAVERSLVVREACPLLHDAMPLIGHFQIRNRGTVGGSLAHADPAAELPAVVTALDGVLVACSARRERTIAPDRFFAGALTTALEPDELLTEVRLPATPPRTGHAFLEVSRRHGDFALVGVAASVTLDADGVCLKAAAALSGVGSVPVRVPAVPDVLVGVRPEALALDEVRRRVAAALTPDSDIHASADYRKQVAGVLVRRALERALGRAQGAAR